MHWTFFYKLGSPKFFYTMSSKWQPWLAFTTIATLIPALIWGLAFAPADYLQGNSYRIIFIHVPAAFLAQSIYMIIAIAAIVHLVWHIKMADIAQAALAPIGTSFTLLTLISGAIWGKPTWGTWWEWDARLTSMLLLLFLYIGLLALRNALQSHMGSKACSILAIVGVVNIPIIKFSVDWWNTLHQGTTLTLTEKPSISIDMLIPLLLSIIGFYLFFALVTIQRLKLEIIGREHKTAWVHRIIR